MNAKQLRDLVIIPTLNYLNLNSDSAVNLLLGTCAQESQMGEYLAQIGGPALGIYQIEPETHRDIIQRYLLLPKNAQLNKLVQSLLSDRDLFTDRHTALIGNLDYATAICRIRYLMAPDALPEANDVPGLAHYWKINYNSPDGAGREPEFLINYHRYVEGKV